MADASGRRGLHWVFKIGSRKDSLKFFKDVLGMTVLRHEEFSEGCVATCNGPYQTSWSKTMIGYGDEDAHFVVELTYNYGIDSYKFTNDFLGYTINSKKAVANAKARDDLDKEFIDTIRDEKGTYEQYLIRSRDGYPFYLNDIDVKPGADPVQKVAIASSNLQRSLDYWHGVLGLTIFDQGPKKALLGYNKDQAKVEIVDVGAPVDHGTAPGRLAFGCPSSQLLGIQSKIEQIKGTILTRHVTLSTPGKADVQVVILADPDGHEIAFVGDEGFRALSKVDPRGEQIFRDAMKNDKQ